MTNCNYVDCTYKLNELIEIKRAMLAKCKDIIKTNIKLEEPINFASFFQEAVNKLQHRYSRNNNNNTVDEKVEAKLTPQNITERIILRRKAKKDSHKKGTLPSGK